MATTFKRLARFFNSQLFIRYIDSFQGIPDRSGEIKKNAALELEIFRVHTGVFL
jgi:hypothetical protein